MEIKMTFQRICLLLLMIVIISSKAISQEVKIIDGVKTIEYTKSIKISKSNKIKLEFIRVVGGTKNDDTNYNFDLPEDITVDNEGNIYVLDRGNYRVKIFDKNYNFLRKFGRYGNKPGKFNLPLSIDITNDGNIITSDKGNKRFDLFTPKGKRLRSFTVDVRIDKFQLDNNDNIIMKYGLNPEYQKMEGTKSVNKKYAPLLIKLDLNGKVIGDIGQTVIYDDPIITYLLNYGYFCIDINNNFNLTLQAKNQIDMYKQNGDLALRVKRILNFEETKPKEVERKKEGFVGTTIIPKMNLVSVGIASDYKGRIWIATLNRQVNENEKISISKTTEYPSNITTTTVEGNTNIVKTDMYDLEVYDRQGNFIDSIRLDHFVDDIKIFNDRLFILDKFRSMRFYEYKILGEIDSK